MGIIFIYRIRRSWSELAECWTFMASYARVVSQPETIILHIHGNEHYCLPHIFLFSSPLPPPHKKPNKKHFQIKSRRSIKFSFRSLVSSSMNWRKKSFSFTSVTSNMPVATLFMRWAWNVCTDWGNLLVRTYVFERNKIGPDKVVFYLNMSLAFVVFLKWLELFYQTSSDYRFLNNVEWLFRAGKIWNSP